MKKFFVAVCCTLMLGGSLMAQDAAPATSPAPVEDVAAPAVPAPAPVAQSSVVDQAAPYGAVVNSGCTNCGGNAVMTSGTPMMQSGCGCGTAMTYTSAPMQSGCGCGTPMTYTAAPMQSTPCCGQAAPVAAVDCCAPVDPCCDSGRRMGNRVGFLAKRRARRNCCSY